MSPNAGDPVGCGTGQFVHAHKDLSLKDVVPLTLQRLYESGDNTRHIFGLGTSAGLDYNIYTPTAGSVNQLVLVTPSGGGIVFTCTTGCSSYLTAQLQAQQQPGYFYSATMQYDGIEWVITTRDGTVYRIANAGAYLQSITDRFGNTTTYTRSTQQITKITTPNGRWIQFTYTGSVVTQASDNAGRTWNYTYDGFGRVVSATDPLNGVWQYAYNTLGMVTVTDPRTNNVVTNTYDANGRVQQQTYADSSTATFAYTLDGSGNVTQTNFMDRAGNVRQIQFDSNGFVTSNTFALGKPEQQATTFVRQANTNLLTSATDALGRVTAYTYDANGNVASVTLLSGTANAVTTSYAYEPIYNQLSSFTDELNQTTTFSYDAVGNLIQKRDPLGHITKYTYNNQGQRLTVTNPLDFATSYTYDTGVLSSVTDPLSRTTTMFADSVGRGVQMVDPLGNTYSTIYDALNRATQVTNSLGGSLSLEYDANGNLTAHVDPKGNRTQYTYDVMNKRVSKKDPLLNVVTYVFDTASRILSVTDRNSVVTGMTYDGLNRRSQTGFGATPSSPTTYSSTLNYTYDAGNHRLQAIDSANGAIIRSYDGLDRLTSESSPQGTVSYSYDAMGRRVGMTVPGQPNITYSWDAASRMSAITQGTQTVSFTYDAANRRTSVTLPDGIAVNYAYDAANQLTSITYVKGATTLGNLTYAYDNGGRRIDVGGSYANIAEPAQIPSASYNADNQLTQWNGSSLAYDLNGNLTSDGTNTYTWNARNQLSQISQGATVVASYQYDADGRRRGKTINGVTTQYLYDGENFVQEQDATGAATANLLTGLDLDAVYTRTAVAGGNTSNFLVDHLGTIIAEADASGNIASTYTYEPFGKTTAIGTATSNSQRYTGREQDTADLYYLRSRYYSTSLGRFIAEDPVELKGGSNFYAYAYGDPIDFNDPTGRCPPQPQPRPPCQNKKACESEAEIECIHNSMVYCWSSCVLAGPDYFLCVGICLAVEQLYCWWESVQACSGCGRPMGPVRPIRGL